MQCLNSTTAKETSSILNVKNQKSEKYYQTIFDKYLNLGFKIQETLAHFESPNPLDELMLENYYKELKEAAYFIEMH